MLEEYHAKGKMLYICFVDIEKAFNIVQIQVLEWEVRKKGIKNMKKIMH